MAAQEILEDPQEEPFNNSKKWILKVSIHCEGCKRKVEKILRKLEGVHETEIDAKQQKVTVTGNVDADTLLRKLNKARVHAELWPESPDQKDKNSAKPKKKEKVVDSQQETSQSAVNVDSEVITHVKEVKPPLVKAEVAAQVPCKDSQDGGADNRSIGEDGGAGKVGGAAKSKTPVLEENVAVGNSKTSGADDVAKESNKSEGKKPESNSGGARATTVATAEENGGESDENNPGVIVGKVGGFNDSGSGGKKKKSTGQKGNNNVTEQQQSSVPVGTVGSRDHEDGTRNIPFPDHHSGPPHPFYDHYYPPQFYGPPGPPPPALMYATVSYHTARPTGSYTASYYHPQQPYSYVYPHPGGTEVQPAPSDFDPYSSRQPLDSFEMFSDENPNGCSIM